MATLTPTPPVKDKPNKPASRRRVTRPIPPDDFVPSGPTGGTTYPSEEETPFVPPARKRSVWPFLLDFGLVMALFGLIIGNIAIPQFGPVLIVMGVAIFLTALVGWIREARAEYSKLQD